MKSFEDNWQQWPMTILVNWKYRNNTVWEMNVMRKPSVCTKYLSKQRVLTGDYYKYSTYLLKEMNISFCHLFPVHKPSIQLGTDLRNGVICPLYIEIDIINSAIDKVHLYIEETNYSVPQITPQSLRYVKPLLYKIANSI